MRPAAEGTATAVAAWTVAALVVAVPIAIAAASPLAASRDAMWIVGGLAGALALALLFLQPLLAGGFMPRLAVAAGRRWHRWIGTAVVLAVVTHVGGLYVTSPEDIADSLLLVSPTPFAVYGVLAMWAVFATACVAALRAKVPPAVWRALHMTLAIVIAGAGVMHALLIEGVMGETSKLVLCIALLAATAAAVLRVALGGRTARPKPARTKDPLRNV